MDLQTQVVPADQVTLSQLDAQARLAAFKTSLSQLRYARTQIVEKMRALKAGVDKLIASRDNLFAMYHSEVLAMYPQLSVRDLDNFVQSAKPGDAAAQLWQQYQIQAQGMEAGIREKVEQFNALMAEDQKKAAQEEEIFSQYAALQIPGLPSVEQLRSELAALEVIPQVQAGNVQVSINAIDELNPEAAAMVLNQAVSMETGYNRAEVNEVLETTMVPGQIEEVSDSLIKRLNTLAEQNGGKKFWGILLGIAVVIYVLGGRD